MRKGLKASNGVGPLLKSIEGRCSLTVNVLVEGSLHLQQKLTADGWGPAACMGFNAATKKTREQIAGMLS